MPASRKRAQFVGGNHRAHRSKGGMKPDLHQSRFWRTQKADRLDEIIDQEIQDEIDDINGNPDDHE